MIEVSAARFAWISVEELDLSSCGELFFEIVEDVLFREFLFIDMDVAGGAAIDRVDLHEGDVGENVRQNNLLGFLRRVQEVPERRISQFAAQLCPVPIDPLD